MVGRRSSWSVGQPDAGGEGTLVGLSASPLADERSRPFQIVQLQVDFTQFGNGLTGASRVQGQSEAGEATIGGGELPVVTQVLPSFSKIGIGGIQDTAVWYRSWHLQVPPPSVMLSRDPRSPRVQARRHPGNRPWPDPMVDAGIIPGCPPA